MTLSLRWVSVAVLILAAGPAVGQGGRDRSVSTVAGLTQALAAARPGDRVLLAPGRYVGNVHVRNVHGTADRPIVVTAADPVRPPVLTGSGTALHISGASHLEISDLEIVRAGTNGLSIDDGDNRDRPAHHVILRNLRVTDTNGRGNNDGIKLSGVDDLVIDRCVVRRWGNGGSGIDLVGCHRVVVSDCLFADGGANAVQFKGGSADVRVAGCKFLDAGERAVQFGGVTGDGFFRPPLERTPAGTRAEVRNGVVEGCVFVGGEAAVAAVSADGVTVRFNTIYRPTKYPFRILQENPNPGFVPCRNGTITDNVIVVRSGWPDGGVNIGPGTEPKTFKFARNLWFCEERPAAGPQLPTPEENGVVGVDPKFIDPAKRNFSVRADSPAAARGAHAWMPKK